MSKISVDTITDEAGTGAPDFPNGISATGPFTSLGIDDNATSTALTVDSAGKLGVGTASPTEKLDVAGTVKATSFSGDGSSLTGINDLVKAWVNFNGTGVVAIRASYNVSSITDLGAGSYRINFTTNMSDVDYAVNLSGNNTGSFGYTFSVPANGAVPAVGSIDVVTAAGAVGTDLNYVYISIFR